uniref:hypothetical protein n=1 Tax=Paracoccus marcusii TaxID=59779 RepID=UPI00155D8D27|nr:hypothetical protein [Paracoccus marcusii]
MTHPSTNSRLDDGASSETIRRLDTDDHLTRLADLLHLIAAAADGLPPPHGAAIMRGTQIALDEVKVIQSTIAQI